jgi:two-component system, NarL family, sensor histidine kinase UhpB
MTLGCNIVHKIAAIFVTLQRRWHLSLFEKVILVNSIMLVGEALAGLWVTSHNLEAHHYLIDTGFIILATLLTLLINIFVLRMSFRPLFGLLSTIREITTGQTSARAAVTSYDYEIAELSQAFNSMLDRLEAARHEQTMLILQAQEDERRRVGLELHDEAGQNLTALLIHIEILFQHLQDLPTTSIDAGTRKQLENGIQQLTSLTQYTLENVRVLAQQLRPSVLDDLGLLPAFRWLVEDSQQRLHLDVELRVDSTNPSVYPLPAAYETALFRIVQESLTNIARHAQTQQAIIELKQDELQVDLSIHDEGCGYDFATHHAGSGIIGMRERAALLKGTLTIHSGPGHGTTIQVVLPLPQERIIIEQVRG